MNNLTNDKVLEKIERNIERMNIRNKKLINNFKNG